MRVSVHLYPTQVVVVANDEIMARHQRLAGLPTIAQSKSNAQLWVKFQST
jgi:hypothetical protein